MNDRKEEKEMQDKKKIPTAIQQLIGTRPYYIDDIGKSSSQVICFDDMILKIQECSEESENELRMMKWLQGKLPVPCILQEEKVDKIQYLLMSRMPGEMSCAESYMDREDALTGLLAEGLKMLWSVDITDCPYNNTLEQKLRQARNRVEQGLCDMRCGVADRYQDIALCYRSLLNNYSGAYGGKVYPTFHPERLFEELGLAPDWEKVRYYILLDELF